MVQLGRDPHVRLAPCPGQPAAQHHSLAWLAATWAFHIYLKFSALDSFYGALASVILGFIWLSFSVSALLLGAALAVEWASRLPREGLIAEEEEAGADGAITI
jgi:uncharacterized BrkB/YihY/UPF0761 family membrane protein